MFEKFPLMSMETRSSDAKCFRHFEGCLILVLLCLCLILSAPVISITEASSGENGRELHSDSKVRVPNSFISVWGKTNQRGNNHKIHVWK